MRKFADVPINAIFFLVLSILVEPTGAELVDTSSQLKLEHKLDTSKKAPMVKSKNGANGFQLVWTGAVAAQ